MAHQTTSRAARHVLEHNSCGSRHCDLAGRINLQFTSPREKGGTKMMRLCCGSDADHSIVAPPSATPLGERERNWPAWPCLRVDGGQPMRQSAFRTRHGPGTRGGGCPSQSPRGGKRRGQQVLVALVPKTGRCTSGHEAWKRVQHPVDSTRSLLLSWLIGALPRRSRGRRGGKPSIHRWGGGGVSGVVILSPLEPRFAAERGGRRAWDEGDLNRLVGSGWGSLSGIRAVLFAGGPSP